MAALTLLLLAFSYLMGSICSAVIVCRLFNLPDPREQGSKNPGATNVLRLAGKNYAAVVMLTDILKGTIPVLVAQLMGASPLILAFTVLAAVVGHMFPIFFSFKGGKGVATAIGALIGMDIFIGILVAVTWLLVAKFSRYSSLASIIAIILSPFYALMIIGYPEILIPLFIMVLLVLYKHENNIKRLIKGTEPKIKLKSTMVDESIEVDSPTFSKEIETKSHTTSVDKKPSVKTPASKNKNIEKQKSEAKKTKTTKSKTPTAASKEKTKKKSVVKKKTPDKE